MATDTTRKFRQLVLPPWAAEEKTVRGGKEVSDIIVFADQAYPALLAELGVRDTPLEKGEDADPAVPTLDQYWAEVVYQCAKLDVQMAVAGTHVMIPGGAYTILIRTENKDRWKHSNLPKGRGVAAASRGVGAAGADDDARAHYRRIRGFLPS